MKPLRVVAGSIVAIALLVSSGHAERVGPTDTWVDDARPLAYRIEGGLKEFQATGEICNLMQSFVVKGDGVTIKFIPKSNGRYEYSGKVGGVDVEGRGTYVVEYDDHSAIKLVATEFFYMLKRAPGACQG
jgi:hypothetical protein